MSDASIGYVATAPCGCVHGIDCDDDEATAKQVAEWIKRGSTVDRRSLGEAKAAIVMDCPHDPRWGRT